jgi:hypothetical protein
MKNKKGKVHRFQDFQKPATLGDLLKPGEISSLATPSTDEILRRLEATGDPRAAKIIEDIKRGQDTKS